eukprot:9110508-Alexandrium_andersonii.AAC.1
MATTRGATGGRATLKSRLLEPQLGDRLAGIFTAQGAQRAIRNPRKGLSAPQSASIRNPPCVKRKIASG